jgi:hypothetical protein
MLKLTLQHSKDYGVRKRSFRPMLKLTLQHSKDYGDAEDGRTAVRPYTFCGLG